jgi:hypothetical protein
VPHSGQALGDDVAGLADEHGVAGAHVPAGDLVLVVQRGEADGGAGDHHRLQLRERGGHTGPPDRHLDVLEQGGALLGRELVRDRPAGRLGGVAELLLLPGAVDLDHHPVDLVLEVVAVLGPAGDERLHLVEGRDARGLPRHRQAGPLAVGEELGVGGEAHPLRQPERVAQQLERPAGGHLGVLLPQGAGGGVAGVGEDLLALVGLLLVEPLEGLGREEDLAADLERGWWLVEGEPVRDAGDGADVGGDVVADQPVPPGRGPGQPAPLVLEGDRDAVDLDLADVGGDVAHDALGAPAPGGQLLGGEGVVQRQHRHPVPHRRERRRLRRPHHLGGRVGGAQVGVVVLEPLELPQQLVVLGVGDVGVAEDVVAVGRVPQPRPQLVDPAGRLLRRHRHGRSSWLGSP